MALKKSFHCVECDEDFAPYNWVNGRTGHRHVVEAKTYYSPASNWLTYVAEEKMLTTDEGKSRWIPAKSAQFGNGTYTTSDPEYQFALDEQCKMTREEWEKQFLGEKEYDSKKKREMEAEIRALREQNALLMKVKEDAVKAGVK